MLLRASAHLEGDRLVPHYFTVRDEPWLGRLIAAYAHFAGRKCADLGERLREPGAARAPKIKLRIAILILDGLTRARATAAAPPKEVRAALFRAAAASHAARPVVLSSVAASFALTVPELESALFADLKSERRIAALPAAISPSRLVTDANLAIVSSFMRRATHVRIVVRGNFRALLRQARVAGLICRAARLDRAADGVVLDVSGPFALFHHSDLYGRALASLIPRLASCDEFELTASCTLAHSHQPASLVLRSAEFLPAPAASAAASALDGRLERKFERDFRRAARGWDLSREPPVISAGERLIFPDFALAPARDPSERWLLEIVGFWTPEYLRGKLQCLASANIERFVLCVDQSRECAEAELPPDPRIIPYKSRIDAHAVLALITSER